jgi:hypothetical protein
MRHNRHGWNHQRQPEYLIRTAVAVCIIVIIILAAFALFGR